MNSSVRESLVRTQEVESVAAVVIGDTDGITVGSVRECSKSPESVAVLATGNISALTALDSDNRPRDPLQWTMDCADGMRFIVPPSEQHLSAL